MRAGFLGDKLAGIAIIVWATISIVLCCLSGGSAFKQGPKTATRESLAAAIGNGPPKQPSIAHAKSFENVQEVADELGIFIAATTILELIVLIVAAFFLIKCHGGGFLIVALFSAQLYYGTAFVAMPLPIAIPVLVYCVVRLATSFGPRPIWSARNMATSKF